MYINPLTPRLRKYCRKEGRKNIWGEVLWKCFILDIIWLSQSWNHNSCFYLHNIKQNEVHDLQLPYYNEEILSVDSSWCRLNNLFFRTWPLVGFLCSSEWLHTYTVWQGSTEFTGYHLVKTAWNWGRGLCWGYWWS